jgi:hypothetical protein
VIGELVKKDKLGKDEQASKSILVYAYILI